MAQMVEKKTYTAGDKDIVLNPNGSYFAIGVQVTNTGVSADAEGRKIIKAGTPIGGSTSVLDDRDAVLVVTNTADDGANAQGVIRHDTDVTAGATNATMIVRGEIDSTKCPTLAAAAVAALTHIIFVNGGKN